MADEPAAATADEPEKTDDIEVPEGAENPDAVRNAIRSWRDKARDAAKTRDELAAKVEEFENAGRSEKEKLESKASDAEKRATVAEMKALRFEVAAAKNIPLNQAHRLVGTTKEELEKDAEDFAKNLGAEQTPSFDGGAGRGAAPKQDMDQLIRSAAGRS